MHYRVAMLLLCSAAAGCSFSSEPDHKHYSIYFPSYSAELDQQGHRAVAEAAAVARANPALPVELAGFSAPPDPSRDVDRLSARRAARVKQALIADGVGPDRISTVANGTTDPNGLPNLSVQRVDISIGR